MTAMTIAETGEVRLARLLVNALETGTPLPRLPEDLLPSSADAAYAVQLEILRQRKVGIGGWKVGAKSTTGPIQGALLPADCVHSSPVTLRRNSFWTLGLQLEIAFGFGRTFEPSGRTYSDDEVLEGVKFMAAAIEIVSSRFAQWPNVEKLGQLADLQNHGALVVGQFAEYQDEYSFAAPRIRFSYEGTDIAQAFPANPAGEDRA